MNYIARNWLFLLPLAVFAGFYLFQNAIGIATLPSDLVITFVWLLALSTVAYVAAYHLVPAQWLDALRIVKVPSGFIEGLAIAVVVAYALLLVLASATAPEGVALIEAFKGATAYELGVLRETFLRTRSGGWQVLNYLYAIMSNALMPVVVTYAYHRRHKWRHIALAVLVFGLTITLSKGAIAAAALPLLALFLMEKRFRAAAGAIVLLLGVVGTMYFLSSGRLGAWVNAPAVEVASDANEGLTPANEPAGVEDHPAEQSAAPAGGEPPIDADATPAPPQVQDSSAVPDSYNVVGRDDQVSLAVNRIVWIPYVTAIDWLRYQRDYLDGEFLLGRSIKPFAALLGWEPLSLEREVANMQWGQNETGTASSNAVFFIDAWINFGIVGVVLYSALLALTIRLILLSGSKPLAAAASVPIYTACFLALPPMYLSGGLALFVLMALVSPADRKKPGTVAA